MSEILQSTEPVMVDERMQVVKGFSVLTYGYLRSNLPDPRERKSFDVHWPKRNGCFWNCWYGFETTGPVATLVLFSDSVELILHDGAGRGREVYFGKERFRGSSLYEILAEKIPTSDLGKRLLNHLQETSKKTSCVP